MKEQEKSILGHQTVRSFCQQFGDDVYAQTLLEVLMEGLYRDETVFVLGEERQERVETRYDSQGRVICERAADGPQGTETSPSLAEGDREDHLGQQDALRTEDRDG